MDKETQIQKAERLLELHHDPKLLVLPNIWDPLGARLLESMGYPAVATASAAVAYSLGYDDGQRIRFDVMLDAIYKITASVDVPVTADIERGYADDPSDVAENVGRVIRAGAVGINIEDSLTEGGELRSVEEQCARIEAVRRTAVKEGIPLVINARSDVFVGRVPGSHEDKVAEMIERARAYLRAGADCIYPIVLGDMDALKAIYAAIQAPINVYATKGTPPMKALEAAGISRLSLGPWFLKASLTTMKRVAEALKDYGSYDVFTKDAIENSEVLEFLCKDKME